MDFNRTIHSAAPINIAINKLIEAAAARTPEVNTRQYLGASSIGSECLRRMQYDWLVNSVHPLRTRDIFQRGHVFERLSQNTSPMPAFASHPTTSSALARLMDCCAGTPTALSLPVPTCPALI